MKRGEAGVLIALVLMACAMLIPSCPGGLDGAPADDVSLGVVHSDITVSAGKSGTVYVIVWNEKAAGEIYARVVGYEGSTSLVGIGYPSAPVGIAPGKSAVIEITVSPDAYAPTQDDTVVFTVRIRSTEGMEELQTDPVSIHIVSNLSSGDSYNKIMGMYGSPWTDPVYATAASAAIWMVVSFVISFLIVPWVLFLFVRETKENRHDIRRQVWKPVWLLILLYALPSCARIYGAGEHAIATIDSFVDISYVLVGALITWRIYRAVVRFLLGRMSEKAGDIGIDETLIPLFNMLGKIAIAGAAFAGVLAALGFNLMAMVTGAGILGIAISLGAQNSLSQFFSGLILLITRPFRVGDLVTIGNNGTVLKVVRVGLMNTTFEEDANTGTFTMPNNTVSTSVINNITGKTRAYRVTFYVGIGYDADVELAKKLLLEAAYEHPRVISDGSYDLPSVRLESFDASSVNMRVSVYVEDFADRGSIAGQIRESLFRKFGENGITIPFPQIDVHTK